MKFYRLGDIPFRRDDLVFKAPVTGVLIWCCVYSGIAIALLRFGISGAKIAGLNLPSGLVFYGGAAVFGLLGWAAWGQFRARRKPSNWLLRCQAGGVLIKYRSYQNWRCPADDVQAVGIDDSEIAEVRLVREQRTVPGLGGKGNQQVQRLTFLVFRLVNADTSALEARLLAEQKAEPPGLFKTIYRDYPVAVLPGGIIQLRWSFSGGYKISPSPNRAMEYLSGRVKIAGPDATKIDLTRPGQPGPEAGDAQILKLARSGDTLGAVKLTRQLYGSTLDEAVAYVEKLQSGVDG
jgi:hypothetical protein